MNTGVQKGFSSDRYRRLAAAALTILTLALGFAPSVFASLSVDLGSAADYAVVGVGGSVSIQSQFQIYQSATVINGNVAQGPYSALTHGIDATVNGRWDYDITNSNPAASGYTGSVTGGFHQLDLSDVAADARAAALQGSLLAPTQTYLSLNQFDGVGSIVGTAGVNVIRITGDSALKISLTLIGTATSTFVFQFTSPTTAGHNVLSLSGANMIIGGINPDNIYWDFNGTGGDVNIQSMAPGQTVYGNFLAPDRNITSDHGIIDGRLIGGGSGSLLSIHSGSDITFPGTALAPESSTFGVFGLGLAAACAFSRFRGFQRAAQPMLA